MSNTFTQAYTTALPSVPDTATEKTPTSPVTELLDVEPAATSTELSTNVQRVETITTEILQHKRQVAHSFIQIGLLLDEARGRLKKEGQWLYWLKTASIFHRGWPNAISRWPKRSRMRQRCRILE